MGRRKGKKRGERGNKINKNYRDLTKREPQVP